jgi:hypothetical protein
MNVITTTNIIRQGRWYPEGTKFNLSEDDAKSLIDQGVARRATRTVEVEYDEPQETRQTKVPAKSSPAAQTAATDSDPANPPAAEGETSQGEVPKFNKDMSRDKLDQIAVNLGMDEKSLEQYEKKAELVEAMKAHVASQQNKANS